MDISAAAGNIIVKRQISCQNYYGLFENRGNDGFLTKMVSFKKKTRSNRRLTRLFNAEDDRLGAKRQRFRFFKQALIFDQGIDK